MPNVHVLSVSDKPLTQRLLLIDTNTRTYFIFAKVDNPWSTELD